jgi:hypothetical protein
MSNTRSIMPGIYWLCIIILAAALVIGVLL